MKKTFVLACMFFALMSCEKLSGNRPCPKEKPCPVVSSDSIPSTLRTSFAQKYPNASDVIWFDKDGHGFCALFTNGALTTRAMYDHDGVFIDERSEDHSKCGPHDHDGRPRHHHKDDRKRDQRPPEKGCRCELDHE